MFGPGAIAADGLQDSGWAGQMRGRIRVKPTQWGCFFTNEATNKHAAVNTFLLTSILPLKKLAETLRSLTRERMRGSPESKESAPIVDEEIGADPLANLAGSAT